MRLHASTRAREFLPSLTAFIGDTKLFLIWISLPKYIVKFLKDTNSAFLVKPRRIIHKYLLTEKVFDEARELPSKFPFGKLTISKCVHKYEKGDAILIPGAQWDIKLFLWEYY